MKKRKSKSPFVSITRLTGRGRITTYMRREDYERMVKRNKNRCRVRVVIGDSKMISPNEILFGPGYADLPGNATADWTPENHKDYYKRYK